MFNIIMTIIQVNIIPVIGKADCCTKEEILRFKKKVGNPFFKLLYLNKKKL